jgi:hypothetical protein
LQLAIYFFLHGGQFLGKHCKLASPHFWRAFHY